MSLSLNLHNISVKIKIYALVGSLIAAMAISVIYALMTMSRIGEKLVAIAEEDIPLTKVITEITVHQLEQAINFERALRFGENLDKESTAAKHYKDSVQKFRSYMHKVDEEIIKGESLAEHAMLLAHSEAEKKEFKHIDESLKKIEQEHKDFSERSEQVFKLVSQGKLHDAYVLAEKVELEEESINHELVNLLVGIENFTEQAALAAEHDELTAFRNLIFIAGIASVIALIIAFIIISDISKGLQRAVASAQSIANGDLTEEIHSYGSDEIGKLLTSLGNMKDKLHTMIKSMNNASIELATSSEELTTVSEDTNRVLHTQQNEIQQAATAMTEMTAAVQEVASNAQLTSASANDANLESQQGQQVVKSTVDAIESLAGVVDNANSVIQQVGQDSINIGTVLDVIKSIAEQTNLLALNAAIEAARAGEQGRGFAVVADEVRTLAQRTQESTSEIEEMISRLQSSSKNAVDAMETGRDQASVSVEQAIKAGVSLESIARMISQINDMNIQIASAAEEQSSVAEDVSRNVNNISAVTDQNAAAVNQITVSSEELSRMAVNLQQMIAQFKV